MAGYELAVFHHGQLGRREVFVAEIHDGLAGLKAAMQQNSSPNRSQSNGGSFLAGLCSRLSEDRGESPLSDLSQMTA